MEAENSEEGIIAVRIFGTWELLRNQGKEKMLL